MRILLKTTILCTVYGLITGSCSLDTGNANCLNGEGPLMTETRTVTNFKAISQQMPGSIVIAQASFPSLTIEGQANLLPFLGSEIKNEVLVLAFTDCVETGLPFKATVTVIDLEAVTLSGIGDISFQNDITSSRLELSLRGLGSMNLRGTSDTLEINITGQGDVNAFNLISDHCEVQIQSVGDVEVTANNKLIVTINGQGNVFYKGMPDITSTINGQGTIVDAN